MADYLPYRVPEVWLLKNQQLFIYQLHQENYQLQSRSIYFPGIDIQEIITRCIQITYERNTSAAIRDLKQLLNKL